MGAEVPFVGRENELAELEAMLRGVEEDGAGHLRIGLGCRC